jgi:hypothetical protein
MAKCHNNTQKKLKMIFFANENEKLNHEKVEGKEPTSLSLMVRRMDARNSHNLTPNFEGKRGFFGLNVIG